MISEFRIRIYLLYYHDQNCAASRIVVVYNFTPYNALRYNKWAIGLLSILQF